ncbi:MAG: RNA methyltransferase [Methanomicrobiales archaeon]|jgi:TrmH family RNA methyltransferase|nr:RNA methyltransferase [Methanomicrobiales archaeon]
MRIRIVLVEPLYDGNIGFAARAMKNFGFTELVLINPCEIRDEGVARASHAKDVLENASYLTLDEVFETSNITIATTGSVSKSACHPMRMPFYTPQELREFLGDVDGTVSILFGRENWGLNNEEVKRCDIICTLPTSEIYPIANLSHVVAIICYELSHLKPTVAIPLATPKEMDQLYIHIAEFLDDVEHPDFKRENTMILIRRVLGRMKLTWREVSTIHGLMRRAQDRINFGKK